MTELGGAQRIALFGGSFDPPHLGHVALAHAAVQRFHLDQVLVAPAGRQPLKSSAPAASFDQRMEMCRLAFQSSLLSFRSGAEESAVSDAGFIVSNIDAPRFDHHPNYTVDTLARLAQLYPAAELFSLAGADSFLTLAQWREPHRLLALAQWIVVSRPGFPLLEPPGLVLNAEHRARIHLLDSIHLDVAATQLRERLLTGDPCTDLLPPAVSAYIQRHHLYFSSAP